MGCKITISDLKNVKNLEFELPSEGVWLLTGVNGAGKSTLLACIQRLWDPIAFPRFFKPSLQSSTVDSFKGASITYEIDSETVIYEYKEERWVPHPKRLSKLLAESPYADGIYLAADPDRIQPRQEDLRPHRIKKAPPKLIKYANQILDTDRFNNLYWVNATRGKSQALLIEKTVGGKKTYFSERNFSLGELCVLKLLRSVLDQKVGSLVLIDEVELALHPSAQVRLLEALKEISKEKRNLVLVVSHSVTLIKSIERERILFLEGMEGKVALKKGCYPSYVLGHVALTEESLNDSVICVEDDHSHFLLEAILDRFKTSRQTVSDRMASLSINRIGGAAQVVKMIEVCNRILHDSTKRVGVLDKDVEEVLSDTDTAGHARRYIQENQKNFKFLPVTPEVGLVQWFSRDADVSNKVGTALGISSLQVTIDKNAIDNSLSLSGKPLRDSCKRIVKSFFSNLQKRSGKELPIICREIYFLYVKNMSKDEWEDAEKLSQELLF